MPTRIVETKLLTEGVIPLYQIPESRFERFKRWLRRGPAPRVDLNLFQANMSAYRFRTHRGALAVVPFNNELLDDSAVSVKTLAMTLALPQLEEQERQMIEVEWV